MSQKLKTTYKASTSKVSAKITVEIHEYLSAKEFPNSYSNCFCFVLGRTSSGMFSVGS